MVLESVVADLLNRFLGDYVENLNKSQLKLGIWGGKREGAAGGLPALAEGPTPRAPPARLQAGPGSLRRPRLRLRGGPSAGPPPRAAGAGCREACARFRRRGAPGPRPGWGEAAGSRSRCPSSHLSRPGGGLRALSRPALLGGSSRCPQLARFAPQHLEKLSPPAPRAVGMAAWSTHALIKWRQGRRKKEIAFRSYLLLAFYGEQELASFSLGLQGFGKGSLGPGSSSLKASLVWLLTVRAAFEKTISSLNIYFASVRARLSVLFWMIEKNN